MFLVKQLASALWGGSSEMVQLSGKFYQKESNLFQCLFNHATCTICKVAENSFELVVARVFEEGEKELEDSLEDAPTEFSFHIDPLIAFHAGVGPLDRSAFIWTDKSKDKSVMFEVDEESTGHMVDLFRETFSQCLEEHNPTTTSTPLPEVVDTSTTSGEQVHSSVVDLYLYDANQKQFEFRQKNVELVLEDNYPASNKEFQFRLLIKEGEETLFVQEVSNEMHLQCDKDRNAVVWFCCNNGQVCTWSAVFKTGSAGLDEFKKVFHECLWSTNSQKPFSDVKGGDVDWILGGYDSETEDDTYGSEISADEEEEEDAMDIEELGRSHWKEKGGNSFLSVASNYPRSFIARGDNIGVFSTDGEAVEHCTTLSHLLTPDRKVCTPKKMMLHDQDNSLLLLSNDNKKSVYRMDLERGDIVDEWKMGDGFSVDEVFPESKLACNTPTRTCIGMNKQGCFMIDPRQSGNKQVDSKSFMYQRRVDPQLSCAATSKDGQIAVGSARGQIRMFSGRTFDKEIQDPLERKPRAKTLLPGFGDPIIGIDVSADGEWILATCKTYLMVIPTKLPNGSTGFERQMGKRKPPPRRLQLRQADIQRLGGVVSFKPAKFDSGMGLEQSIVTASGNFVIIWNFRSVKLNRLQSYKIREYSGEVVADQFTFDDSRNVVVALEDDVALAHRPSPRRRLF